MASKVEILGGQLDGSTLDNAASESTLRELVEAIKKLEKTTKDSRTGGTTSKLSNSKPEIDTKDATDALDSFGKSMGKGAAAVVGGLGKLSGAALSAAGSVAKSLGQMGGLISTGNNNLSQFVGVLDALPGPLGKFASAVATGIAALEEMQQTQRDLAKTGASFNNSMMEMRMTAARSGLNLKDFADVLKENAQSIGGLGDTITDGAKKLADVGNAVGASGLDESFMKLGMSASDARKAAMKFSTELVKGDKVRGASANELASASLDYEKDLDLLAKQTGKSKDELRKFSEGMIKGGGAMTFAFAKMSPQMQAAMKDIMNSVGATMGQGAQEAMADVFSGAAAPSSEASAMFQSQMPGVVSTFKQMRDVASLVATTDEERAAKSAQMDSLKAQAASDQLKYLQSAQGQFMMQNKTKLSPAQRQFIEGLEAQAKSLSEQGIDINTASKADIERVMSAKRAEQERQAALDKGFNAFQATITKLFAAVQQAFFGALAPRLEKFAEKLQGIGKALDDMGISVETITPVIGYIMDLLGITLGGAFEVVAHVAQKVYQGLQTLITPFMDLFKALGIVSDSVDGTSDTLGALMNVVVEVGGFLKDILGGAIDLLVVIIKGVVEGLTGLVNIIKSAVSALMSIIPVSQGLKDMFASIPNLLRKVFSTEFGQAMVDGVKMMFNKMFGGLFSMLGNIPGLGKLGDMGKAMLTAAEDNEKSMETNNQAANAQVAAREQAVAADVAAKKQEVAAATANYKTAADAGKSEAAARRKREADDAEAAANKKNSIKDLASADAMERSRAAAIAGMRERAGISEAKPAVAPSPGYGPAAPSTGGAGAPPIKMQGLGRVAAQFESGGNAGTVSTGHGDAGGKSYGAFQLSSKTGDVDKFLQKSGYADKFKGKEVGSKEFDEQWKALAKDDKGFGEAQQAHAKTTHYDPQMAKLQKAGVDLSGKGSGVQEAVMSTANQYGANTSVITDALKGKDTAKMSDKEIIDAIQDYKAASVKTKFKSSSEAVQAGVAKRIEQERMALYQAGGEAATAPGTAVASAAGKDKKAGGEAVTAPGTAVASAAGKDKKPGGTVPNGQSAVAATTTQPTTQVASADQAAKDKADKDKAQADKDKAAQTQTAAATNPMSEVIASLNTSLGQLTMLQAKAVSIAEQQLRATNGLSRDAYKAV
jgi:hypothetical protein